MTSANAHRDFFDSRHPIVVAWNRSLSWVCNNAASVGPERDTWRVTVSLRQHHRLLAWCDHDSQAIVVGFRSSRCDYRWRTEILIHECAHIGRPTGHGPTWRRAMAQAACRVGNMGFADLEVKVWQVLFMHIPMTDRERSMAFSLVDLAFGPQGDTTLNGYVADWLEGCREVAALSTCRDVWAEVLHAAQQRLDYPLIRYSRNPPVPRLPMALHAMSGCSPVALPQQE